jgi:hypothetical protein
MAGAVGSSSMAGIVAEEVVDACRPDCLDERWTGSSMIVRLELSLRGLWEDSLEDASIYSLQIATLRHLCSGRQHDDRRVLNSLATVTAVAALSFPSLGAILTNKA